jgi:hypothetical protein
MSRAISPTKIPLFSNILNNFSYTKRNKNLTRKHHPTPIRPRWSGTISCIWHSFWEGVSLKGSTEKIGGKTAYLWKIAKLQRVKRNLYGSTSAWVHCYVLQDEGQQVEDVVLLYNSQFRPNLLSNMKKVPKIAFVQLYPFKPSNSKMGQSVSYSNTTVEEGYFRV